MQTRKAASVLPDPVGAAMRTSRPAAIRGQPSTWAGTGPSGNLRANHCWTSGWNAWSAVMRFSLPQARAIIPLRARTRGVKRPTRSSRREAPEALRLPPASQLAPEPGRVRMAALDLADARLGFRLGRNQVGQGDREVVHREPRRGEDRVDVERVHVPVAQDGLVDERVECRIVRRRAIAGGDGRPAAIG